MSEKLCDRVSFEIDRLFNGAVDVDWLSKDRAKAEKAAVSFVFHGPGTHGVASSVAEGTGHRLVDTATFAAGVAADLANPGNRPFVLAIASYGSGKSHLAVTLSELLSAPEGATAREILRNVGTADPDIAKRLENDLREIGGPVLVLTLNGMNDADLASAMLAQLRERIGADGHSIEPLESLRKRFHIAANMLGNLSPDLASAFVKEAGLANVEEGRARLLAFDEPLYGRAQTFFRSIGMPIQAIGDETAKDVLDRVAAEYLGDGKPYARMLVLFDEFGRYLEFAAGRPQVAGDGALQHLFEGVQAHSDLVSFVGFIQFDLKSYIQRVGSLVRNEAERYVTRFDSAEKYYLSSNLETLVASLLVKKDAPEPDADAVETARERLVGWYESAKNDPSWSDPGAFARIAHGCWPLSPEAMWVLYYISSGGRFLQQRSALSLLKSALDANAGAVLDDDRPALPPVALWTDELHGEFVGMENGAGASSTIVQSYDAVYEKTSQHLSEGEKTVLRALVLVEETKLRAANRDDMVSAVSVFAGMGPDEARACLAELENEKNVIAWDEVFHRFELLADTASKAQFRATLRRKADQEYDEDRRNGLFAGRAPDLPDLNGDLQCGFAEEQRIFTQEWDYEPRHTTWLLFRRSVPNFRTEITNRSRYQSVSERRGLVVYCFVPENEDEATVLDEARRMVRAQCSKVPFLLVLLFDTGRRMTGPLVQLDLLDSLSEADRSQYARLVPVFRSEQEELLKRGVRDAILERHVLCGVSLDAQPARLRAVGDAVFEKLFPKIVPFPFDGYSTRNGNAAKDCAEFTRTLFLSDFSWDTTQAMGPQKRNRAQGVLGKSWTVFDTNGKVSFKKAHSSVKSLMDEWNKALLSDEGLSFSGAIKKACSSPYGASIASAGLLLSVFFRAHDNAKDIQTMSGDDAVDIQALADSFSERKPLDPDDFDGIRFVRASSGEDSPWQSLIDDWSDCVAHREKTAFRERIDALRETNPKIPPQLRPKIAEIETEILRTQRLMEEIDRRESEHINRIVVALRKEDVYQLAFGVSLLFDDLKSKKGQLHLWDKTLDIDPLERDVQKNKQWIVAWFPQWLQAFNPKGETADAVADFKEIGNKRMGRSLRNLELFDQEVQLRSHVEKVCRQLDAISEARARKRDAEAWAESHSTVPQNLPCSQLDAWKTECEQHREALQRSLASMRTVNPGVANEIAVVYKALNEIRESLLLARKALDRRAGKIFDLTLSMETARNILDEIDAVVHLYEGSPRNQEDFRDARIEVNDYIVLAGQLSNIETSEEMFRERVNKGKADFVEKFTEIEPPWDPQEVFDELVASCEETRAQASRTWVARMLEKYDDPSALSAQETIAAIDELDRRIPCFNPKDAAKLAPVEKALAKHKDDLGVDLLVAQFNALSPAARKQFLERISFRSGKETF